jgi:hypothetical protein
MLAEAGSDHSTDASSPFIASSLSLVGPVPHPFRSGSAIVFEVPAGHVGRVKVTIYDVTGRVVANLVDGSRPPGRQEASWDGKSLTGELVPAGVYFVHLRSGTYTETKKLVLVR